jgi:hypothetical protein
MRVVLNSCYGTTVYPEGCKTEQDVLNLFDSLEEISDENLIESERMTKVIKHKNNLIYTAKLDSGNFYKRLTIVDIDTSKLWRIDEYDGYEFFVYYKIGDNNQLEEIE